MRFHVRLLLLLAALFGDAAIAQTYPTRPVTIVCAFSPGGPTDLIARLYAHELQGILGQPLIVDYKPGANATIGGAYVARAEPDGYYLLLTTASHFINPATQKALPYDTLKDFDAVGTVGRSDIILVVNPKLPVHNVKELVALAKKKPRQLNFGSSGVGGSLHLGGELLNDAAGIQMVHVPYKGGGPTLQAAVTGEVQLTFVAAPPAIAQIKAGGVRVIGVASRQRAEYLPDVPTIEEQGFPKFEVPSAYGMVTTAGAPRSVIERLNHAMNAVLDRESAREALKKIGVTPWRLSPEEFQAWLTEQVGVWKRVAKKINFQPK